MTVLEATAWCAFKSVSNGFLHKVLEDVLGIDPPRLFHHQVQVVLEVFASKWGWSKMDQVHVSDMVVPNLGVKAGKATRTSHDHEFQHSIADLLALTRNNESRRQPRAPTPFQ